MALIFVFSDGGRISVQTMNVDDALATMHASLEKNGIRTGAVYRFGRDMDRVICDVPATYESFLLAGCVRV